MHTMTIPQRSSASPNSNIIELLKQHDILPTTQRVQIAETLFSKMQHVSAEQLLDQVTARGYSISRATVYNTLSLFADKGLVTPVTIDADRLLYDTNNKPHFHFYNEDTGELMDIDANAIEIECIPGLPENTVLSNVDIVLRLHQADIH